MIHIKCPARCSYVPNRWSFHKIVPQCIKHQYSSLYWFCYQFLKFIILRAYFGITHYSPENIHQILHATRIHQLHPVQVVDAHLHCAFGLCWPPVRRPCPHTERDDGSPVLIAERILGDHIDVHVLADEASGRRAEQIARPVLGAVHVAHPGGQVRVAGQRRVVAELLRLAERPVEHGRLHLAGEQLVGMDVAEMVPVDGGRRCAGDGRSDEQQQTEGGED